MKIEFQKVAQRSKKLETEIRRLRSKAGSIDKFTRFKESFLNHKHKSSRVKSGIDDTKIRSEFWKKDRKHLKTEVNIEMTSAVLFSFLNALDRQAV